MRKLLVVPIGLFMTSPAMAEDFPIIGNLGMRGFAITIVVLAFIFIIVAMNKPRKR